MVRTVERSTFEEYLAEEGYPLEVQAEEKRERNVRLARFPYSTMLKVSFPELDFANRWCWRHVGPCDGQCTEHYSQYRVCELPEPHSHVGKWMSHWFEKIAYDFGFNEWYFADQDDHERFVANIENIHWGEKFPR